MLQDNRKHSCGSTEVRSTVLKENLGVAYHRATRTTLRVFVIAVCLSICSFAGPSWHHAKAPRVKLYRSAKRIITAIAMPRFARLLACDANASEAYKLHRFSDQLAIRLP
jgi:hypothetical protein